MKAQALLAALLAVGLGAGAVAQHLPQRDPWHLPATQGGDWPKWDPRRQLTFAFHERARGNIVTGRFVTFEMALGHTTGGYGWLVGAPNAESSAGATLYHNAAFAEDGSVSILPQATSHDGPPRGGTVTPPGFGVRLSSSDSPNHRILERLMIQAKQFNPPFPGKYRLGGGRLALSDPDEVHHVGEHCGFDMFESTTDREWHQHPLDLTRPPLPDILFPHDRARLFGWPNEGGVTYEFELLCEDDQLCLLDAPPRDWLNATYLFRRAWLCEVPKTVHAHRAWLEERVVAEETERVNPAFRKVGE
ncbi:hypothetical protein [Jannaschia aquimarina]|uniref:Uncharacterized protein n=1 Tax=Jannaschia aquimarina TaxID=935700 RepID=A0A0D1CMN9_9RHOB|nr:hypothetical protein [Jannaschia aquimarina]KIT16062.1 hypothetical protein jaqu_23340 [Jannaschia aquimarina]SNT01408.1 hypothetical protein SAMN05421775_104245 [Jannaschia aquimarina]